MNIKDYALEVLKMNSEEKTKQAIARLEWAMKHEEKWNDQHRQEVATLITFLKSGSKDIEELTDY